MPIYTASLKLALPIPIKAEVAPAKPLARLFNHDDVAMTVRLRPELEGDHVKAFCCEVDYDSRELNLVGWFTEPTKGNILQNAGRETVHPLHAAATVAEQVLHNLSALALQPNIFSRRLFQQLLDLEPELVWQKPDGDRVHGIPMAGLLLGRHDIRDPSLVAVADADWRDTQDLLDGKSPGAPLWRVVLADAHQEWGWDIRNATLKCATALEIGLQPSIVRLRQAAKLQGTKGKIGPLHALRHAGPHGPSLEQHRPTIFSDLLQLWHTRHAIIHSGSKDLFGSGRDAIRALTADDVERFLLAVAPGIQYVVANPP